jgi:hypothetical protein
MSAPDLIIITSWTGALLKHIAKYTQTYADLYPTSPILLITTTIADLTLRSTKKKTAALHAAVQYIDTRIRERYTHDYNILLHAFSEGGSNKAICLAKAFLKSTHYQLPVAASIYDSTPGLGRFSNNLAAYKRSLPRNAFMRFFGTAAGFCVLGAIYGFCFVFRPDHDVISKTRRAINDAALWPVRGAPRTYIFSEKDDLIWHKDVEAHAEMSATEHGVLSLLVRYRDSGHCDHMRADEVVYWGAVQKTWEAGMPEMRADELAAYGNAGQPPL